MIIHNCCNAPTSFVDAIKEAVFKSQLISRKLFGLEWQPSSEVYIIDKSEDEPINEKYSINNLTKLLEKLEYKIEELFQIFGASVPESKLLIKNLIRNIRELREIIRTEDGQYSTDFQQSIVKEINNLLDEIKAINNNENNDLFFKEILKIWRETLVTISLIEYPMTKLGFHRPSKDSIYLCYKSISNVIDPKLINELGAFVFSHEYFHAVHYCYFSKNTRDVRLWDSSYRQQQIHRKAVKESLAEYFAFEYANLFLSTELKAHRERTAYSHPFPNWGYAGARLFYEHSNGIGEENPLFKGVFYASIINMDTAFSLF